MSRRILPLCEVVRSQLRSGITITSIAQCVEELVLNSLDAGATCIAVRINFSIFRIQVVDNGHGIKEEDLNHLGTRHATSKCHSLDDLTTNLSHYGFRGEALASTVDISAIVDISTRPQGSTKTLSKLFTYGKMKMIGPAKSSRPSVGTTITIQDFMYNMPVRRKIIKEAIDIENVRRRLESFALMHPKVAFSLRNDGIGSMILQTKKTSSPVSTFIQLFGAERAQGLAEVEHSIDQFTIRGYISTQPHINKALQFVYVNKRVTLKTKIHKMLNFLLSRSSIISTRMHPGSVGSGKPTSPVKGMRLYGIFFLNIECPHSEYDICLDPTKTLVEFREWDKLLICIEEMFLKFIQEEDLVVSLSERYRKSGKWPEEEEEEVEASTSISQLDVFSFKRPGEKGEKSEVQEKRGKSEVQEKGRKSEMPEDGRKSEVQENWEKSRVREKGDKSMPGFTLRLPADKREISDYPGPKYGRTICTQDNLLAVHSLSVKRAKKKLNILEEEKNDEQNEQPSRWELRSAEKMDNSYEKNSSTSCGRNATATDDDDHVSLPPVKKKSSRKAYKNSWVIDKKLKRDHIDPPCKAPPSNKALIHSKITGDCESANERITEDNDCDDEMSGDTECENEMVIGDNEMMKGDNECDNETILNSSQLITQSSIEPTQNNSDDDGDESCVISSIGSTSLNTKSRKFVSTLEQFKRVVNKSLCKGDQSERESRREENRDRSEQGREEMNKQERVMRVGGREMREMMEGGREVREQGRAVREMRKAGRESEQGREMRDGGREMTEEIEKISMRNFQATSQSTERPSADVLRPEGMPGISASEFRANLSTLEEFVSFCEANRRESDQERYKTPADAVLHTPSTPPPLRASRRALVSPLKPHRDLDLTVDSAKSENTQREIALDEGRNHSQVGEIEYVLDNDNSNGRSSKCDDVLSLDGLRGNIPSLSVTRETKSAPSRNTKALTLSKSLSEKFKKHQSHTNTRSILQRFEYKTKAVDHEPRTSKVTLDSSDQIEVGRQDLSRACTLPKDVEKSARNLPNFISESQKEDCTDVLDSSFRFQPVLRSKMGDGTVDDDFQEDRDSFQPIQIRKVNVSCNEEMCGDFQPVLRRSNGDRHIDFDGSMCQIEKRDSIDGSSNFMLPANYENILDIQNKSTQRSHTYNTGDISNHVLPTNRESTLSIQNNLNQHSHTCNIDVSSMCTLPANYESNFKIPNSLNHCCHSSNVQQNSNSHSINPTERERDIVCELGKHNCTDWSPRLEERDKFQNFSVKTSMDPVNFDGQQQQHQWQHHQQQEQKQHHRLQQQHEHHQQQQHQLLATTPTEETMSVRKYVSFSPSIITPTQPFVFRDEHENSKCNTKKDYSDSTCATNLSRAYITDLDSISITSPYVDIPESQGFIPPHTPKEYTPHTVNENAPKPVNENATSKSKSQGFTTETLNETAKYRYVSRNQGFTTETLGETRTQGLTPQTQGETATSVSQGLTIETLNETASPLQGHVCKETHSPPKRNSTETSMLEIPHSLNESICKENNIFHDITSSNDSVCKKTNILASINNSNGSICRQTNIVPNIPNSDGRICKLINILPNVTSCSGSICKETNMLHNITSSNGSICNQAKILANIPNRDTCEYTSSGTMGRDCITRSHSDDLADITEMLSQMENTCKSKNVDKGCSPEYEKALQSILCLQKALSHSTPLCNNILSLKEAHMQSTELHGSSIECDKAPVTVLQKTLAHRTPLPNVLSVKEPHTQTTELHGTSQKCEKVFLSRNVHQQKHLDGTRICNENTESTMEQAECIGSHGASLEYQKDFLSNHMHHQKYSNSTPTSHDITKCIEVHHQHHPECTQSHATDTGMNQAKEMKMEIESSGASSLNPFSESLHFSQLTLSGLERPSPITNTTATTATSILSMEKSDATDPCNITPPTSFSSERGKKFESVESSTCNVNPHKTASSENVKGMLQACEITFDGKDINIRNDQLLENNRARNDTPKIGIGESQPQEREIVGNNSSERESCVSQPLEEQNDENHQQDWNRGSEKSVGSESSEKESGLSRPIEGESGESHPEVQDKNHPSHRWKEIINSEGKRVYVDLKTGNTSYNRPQVKDFPEWTSSQSLGAPLLKVPLTHEPWFVPKGNNMKKREDFTLTHGFTNLLSWKKSRETSRTQDTAFDLKKKGQEGVAGNKESGTERVVGNTDIDDSDSKDGGGSDRKDGRQVPSSREVRETVDLCLKGVETGKATECQDDVAQFSDVAQICKNWEAPDFAMDAEVLNTGAEQITRERTGKRDAAIMVYNAVYEYRFTKDMLHTCKVLGQVDDKYIACSLTYPWADNSTTGPAQLLVLFDQHAVHERIRLEEITRQNYEEQVESSDEKPIRKDRQNQIDEDDKGMPMLRSALMDPPLQLSLPRHEVRLMMAFPRVFTRRGMRFSQVDADTVSFHGIPSCLVAREASEARHRRCQLAASIVESTVRDMCHTLQCTGGVVPPIPTPIANVLNSQACRGAVTFGDHLSPDQCSELISSLGLCQLPFQCAHGRPSIMPLINLAHLPPSPTSHQKSKLSLWKLRKALENQ